MGFLAPAKSLRGRKGRQRAITNTLLRLPDPEVLVTNILSVYDMAELRHGVEGKLWYLQAHELVNGAEREAGILAALSPATNWERNITLFRDMVDTNDCHHIYGNAIDKARLIRNGANPLEILGGRKVRSFFYNILYPRRLGHVTVDRHAVSIALLGANPNKCSSRRTATIPDDEAKGILDRPGGYIIVAAAYRSAARRVGLLPHELQAICWLVWRERYAYLQN